MSRETRDSMPIVVTFVAVIAFLLVFAWPAHAHHYDRLLAPIGVCGVPNQQSPPALQKASMECYAKQARIRYGENAGHINSAMRWSAAMRANDMIECGDNFLDACGRSWRYWSDRSGYQNVACSPSFVNGVGDIASGAYYTSPRRTMSRFLHITATRNVVLMRRAKDLGWGLRRASFSLGLDMTSAWVGYYGWRTC